MISNQREAGLERFRGEVSALNQHYIVYYFLRRDIIDAAEKYARGSLLDVGCGNKPYRNVFTGIESYRGCDIVQSSDNLVDDLCPANALCYQDALFDTVFSTQTMEHVSDFQGMVNESYRILKDGGVAIYTVPFAWELHEQPYDFHRFTKYGLKECFEKAGFKIIEIRANGGKWAAVFQLWLNILLSTRKYKTLRSRIIAFLLVKMKLIYFYNKMAVWIDKKYMDEIFTLNYIIVAQKKK